MPDLLRALLKRIRRGHSLALSTALAGCTFSSMAQPAFEKAGVLATGAPVADVLSRRLSGDEQFSVLHGFRDLDLLGRPRERPSARFCLQLTPNSPPLPTDALTPELTARFVPRWVPTPDEIRRGVRDSFQGQAVFSAPGLFLAFDEGTGRLLSLRIGERDPAALPPPAVAPRAGPADCARLYSPPFSRAQLVDILGAPEWEGWRRDAENVLTIF